MFHSVVFSNDPVGIKEYLNCRLQDNDIYKISKIQKDVNFDKSVLLCPSTSVDVERLFSKLNNLTSFSRNFKGENIVKYLSIILENGSLGGQNK